MINKLFLAIKSIKNLSVLFGDYFGFSKGDVIYRLWNGNSFVARSGTTDYAEIIINNADSEYPSDFYPQNYAPIILDVGANIGETAIFMYRKLIRNNPRIYALEPNPHNYEYLLKNIKINKAKNLKPFKVALTGKTGKANLNFNGENYDGGYINGVMEKQTSSVELVKTITLKDFCEENSIKKIDLLKMDIEGSEYDVFATSLNYIKKNVKSVFVELHNLDKKKNYHAFKRQISKQGFVIKADIMNRTLFFSNPNYKD